MTKTAARVSMFVLVSLTMANGEPMPRPAFTIPTLASGVVALPGGTVRLDTTNAGHSFTTGILLSGAGNLISFCPLLACVISPTIDHQRTSALFAAETMDDGHSEEQTVSILTAVKSGISRKWRPDTRYNVGDNVSFGGNRNSVYRAIVSGVSALSGKGPSGQVDDIVDGSVHWKWINAAAINGKVGLYTETATYPGGGASWGQANNVHLQPGSVPSFNVNTELDFVNDASDCVFGVAACYSLLVSAGGVHQSTTGIYVMSDNPNVFAVHWGIRVAGDHLASDEDIEDDAGAPVGIGLGLFGSAHHVKASIQDNSRGSVSYLITGDHDAATFMDASSSPTTLDVRGRHSAAGVLERSASPDGIALRGHYSEAQVVGNGFVILPDGKIASGALEASNTMTVPFQTPKSSAAPCAKGQIEFDERFIYSCVATNTWRRANSSAF